MFYFDPVYLIMTAPFLLLGLYAQWQVKSTFAKYSRIGNSTRTTGAEAAARMLREAGVNGVRIDRVPGALTDHYDPRTKTVHLSPDVYSGTSLAAVGVACHEVGHAIQDARSYAPLVIRNAAVPLANFGGGAGGGLFFIGLILSSMGLVFGKVLAIAGMLLFAAVVVFQIVNLPVEFNASSRAKQMLPAMGIVSVGPETAAISAVLSAAALTYVAGTLQAVAQLAYYAYVLFGHRSRE